MVAVNNLEYITVTAQSPEGLYVLVSPAVISNPAIFFENAMDQIGIIFPLPDAPSKNFVTAMKGVKDSRGRLVKDNKALMRRLEGFLQYTNYCLNYIYATQTGQRLLSNLRENPHKTIITPSNYHNQTGGMSMCFVAEMVLTVNMNMSETQRTELIQILEKRAKVQGLNAFQWLANQINQMPLYSSYEDANAYPPEFLNNRNMAVGAEDLQQWFNTGSNCNLVINLQEARKIRKVPLLNFVKNAVITLLHAESPPGDGSHSIVSFDVRDWSHNNFEDRNTNTLNDRPPAIGLAHELIHCYHNVRGDQPGINFGNYSTTLFELICVGMGPWADYPVTENAIRHEWPPANVWPPGGDDLNDRAVPQRTVYVAPGNDQVPADMRDGDGPI
jgi:hypothetical protein